MFPQSKNMSIVSATCYILVGGILAFFPNMSAQVVSNSVGAIFALLGVVLLTRYFVLDIKKILYCNDFVFGILCILGGLVIIFQTNLILTLIPIVLGFVIVASGLVKLQRAVIAWRIKSSLSSTYVILSSIAILVGIVIMFFLAGKQSQQVLFIVIGLGLIYAGISDLFVLFFLENSFKKAVESSSFTPEKEAIQEDVNVQ